MSDTDIQYIGEWSSQSVISSATAFVSALILTTTEDNTKSSLTFSRNQSPVVFIGRAAYTNDIPEHEGRATYANPVMSRRHAKITFSDNGSVSLVDTNSHHGTWVNRKTETFKLTPNSPLRLEDGDKITFGKEVLKEGNVHNPLVMTVKLLCNASTPSPRSKSTSTSPESTTRSPRSHRNRFGLSSSSESGLSSDSDEVHLDADTKESNSIESISSLFGIASPKSNPEAISRSPQAICESLPPIDPGVEDEIPQVESGNVENTSNSQPNSVPPWRRFPHPPWFDMTTNFFRHVPDILPRPSLRTDQSSGSRSFRWDNTTHQTPHQHQHHEHEHRQHQHHHGHGHGQHNHHHHDSNYLHDIPMPNTFNNDANDVKENIRILKDELQSLRTLVTTLDQPRVTIGQIQVLLCSLENRIPGLSLKTIEEYLSSPQSPLKSIEETVAETKGTFSTLQAQLSLLDKNFSETLKQNDLSTKDLVTKMNVLDGCCEDLESRLGLDRQDHTLKIDTMKASLLFLRRDLKSLESKFEAEAGRMDVYEESRLESRIKDCVQIELERLRESAESSPVLGKRKRTVDEDYVDATVQTMEGASIIIPPPSKKMKVLNQCIVAGTIGALGAWLGLAFL